MCDTCVWAHGETIKGKLEIMHFSAPIPVLRIFDEEKAREFYVGFLGFTIDWEHRFEPDLPIYMQIRMGDAVMHLSEHFGDATPGSGVRIACEDVDAYCAGLRAKGYKNSRPGVQDQPWGFRETTIADPFGNRITFATENPKADAQ